MNTPKSLVTSTDTEMVKLNLDYTFDPTIVIISQVFDLTVTISNSSLATISVESIVIEIPEGIDAYCLSAKALPGASYTPNNSWTVVDEDGTITVEPMSGNTIQVTPQEAMVFTIKNILVNAASGNVNIDIIEAISSVDEYGNPSTTYASTYDPNYVGPSYIIAKKEADFPVTSFYADPAKVYKQGDTVVLKWACTPLGENDYYQISSDQGYSDSTYYTAEQGANGVPAGGIAVYENTLFTLEIYKSISSGTYSIVGKIDTRVDVVIPKLYKTSYELNVSGIGRLVKLYWVATNATYCKILINNIVYVSQAPVDALAGYLLFVGTTNTTDITISVIACAENGEESEPCEVQQFSVKNPVQHTMNYPTPALYNKAENYADDSTYGIGMTPDGSKAFVMGTCTTILPNMFMPDGCPATIPYMNEITLSNYTCQPIQLLDAHIESIRFTNVAANNQSAYTMINTYDSNHKTIVGYLKKVNLNNNTVDTFTTSGCQVGVSLTTNATQFLLSARSPNPLYISFQYNNAGTDGVISYNTNSLSQALPQLNLDANASCHTMITPDNQFVFVANQASNTVSVASIDLNTGALSLAATVNVGSAPTSTCVTPDGNLALVTNSMSDSISVIDIHNNFNVIGSIPCGGLTPYSIAITNDSKYAYVANKNSGNITLIDIKNQLAAVGALPIGNAAIAVAITPDGKTLLVIQENSPILTSLATS
ncbi:MAG: beta-propeller fold lactonase family protein [Gammaproteobacteria bacterium]|nr:beta-propeller fold lactonase family protein [Gammaproteobacteria bacterium]